MDKLLLIGGVSVINIHGLASIYVINKTKMTEEDYLAKFDQNNIVAVKVSFVTSDGVIHEQDAYLEDLNWTEIEEATEQKPSDPNE